MQKHRRQALKQSLACATLASAAALKPAVGNAWPREAFTTPDMTEAVQMVLGNDMGTESDKIIINAPSFIDEPMIIEATVSTSIPNVDAVALLIQANPLPLAALYTLPVGTEPTVTSRLDIDQSTDIIAVMRSKGKLFSHRRHITIATKPTPKVNEIDDDDDYWNY